MSQFCRLCGCWRGSLGLEPTPELYIEHLVGIFREIKRVLRDDGTLWLNISGSYMGSGQGWQKEDSTSWERKWLKDLGYDRPPTANYKHPRFKPKDWVPIPWMLGMALQADGWWLRSPIIWAKGLSFCEEYSGSVMPESVRDRPTTSYEYLLLLTKQSRYFYDADAVREVHAEPWRSTGRLESRGTKDIDAGVNQGFGLDGIRPRQYNPAGRNLRSVWAINPHPFAEAHFATFPPALVEPCIKAGTSERGCCPECGAPHERVVKKERVIPKAQSAKVAALDVPGSPMYRAGSAQSGLPYTGKSHILGWRPGCSCYDQAIKQFGQIQDEDDAELRRLWEYHLTDTIGIEPCIVLDPFCGSGTTVMVALRLGRRAIGIDLSPSYCEMARKRIIEDCPLLNVPREAT